jgi:hypothetical protein
MAKAYRAEQDLAAKSIARTIEPMRKASESFLKSLSLQTESAKAIAAFEARIPKLIADFPRLTDFVTATAIPPTLQHFRVTLEEWEAIDIPDVEVDADLLDSLSARAEASVNDAETPIDREALADSLRQLQSVHFYLHSDKDPDRHNPFLFLTVLSIVITFLGNQREILETAFIDVATLGEGLGHVWEYAVALLLGVLVYRRIRGK